MSSGRRSKVREKWVHKEDIALTRRSIYPVGSERQLDFTEGKEVPKMCKPCWSDEFML